MKKEYEIGDKAWIYLHNHQGEKTECTVVHKFKLNYGPVYYVCEVPTPVDPLLEVRSAFSMAKSVCSNIGLFDASHQKLNGI